MTRTRPESRAEISAPGPSKIFVVVDVQGRCAGPGNSTTRAVIRPLPLDPLHPRSAVEQHESIVEQHPAISPSTDDMHRREFVKGTAAAAAMSMMPSVLTGASPGSAAAHGRAAAPKPFKLRYAFDAGQFSNSAPGGVVDELKFAHDQGFTAMEDNRMKSRPVAEQEAIAREMQRLGMTMGIILNNGGTGFKANGSLSTGRPEERDAFLAEVRASIECAKRVNAKWMTSLVGMTDPKLPHGFQIANVIDNVRRACELLEPHGLVMVFEPLNVTENHPGFLIHSNDELYM